jgi:hypothetical protein
MQADVEWMRMRTTLAENSDAFLLAKTVPVAEPLLLYGHESLAPTSSLEAIHLLEEFLSDWQDRQDRQGTGVSELFEPLKPYIYGATPMGAAMLQARVTFEAHVARIGPISSSAAWQDRDMLVLVSDGRLTDNER